MKLPSEIEELIKEFAQPLYKRPSHFYAMNTLFSYQKMCIMKFAINTIHPEYNDPCLQTRFNRRYRRVQRNYRNKPIGEIYEDLSLVILGSRAFALVQFKVDIISCSRNIEFDKDEQGKPIKCNVTSMNCSNIYSELVIVVYFLYMLYISCKNIRAMFIITNMHTIPFLAMIHFTPTTFVEMIKIITCIILNIIIQILLYWAYLKHTII